jgi:predicted DCC family thiol-disulfide oxidoreductase YuxK
MTHRPWSWRSDPSVPSFPDDHPLIVFDGECVLCSANAQFVLKHDSRCLFRLTPAQSELGQALYRHFGLSTPDYRTMVVLLDGHLLTQSEGVLAMARGLGWPWRIAEIVRFVPRGLRDALYRLIARNRFRWFGRRDTCWLPSSEFSERIL